MNRTSVSKLALVVLGSLGAAAVLCRASYAADPIDIPTGQRITPTAAPGSSFQELNPGLAGGELRSSPPARP